MKNKGSGKERWSFVSSFWTSSNVRLFTFQWEWENYILPCRAGLQYPVRPTCAANLSFYIVNIKTLYTKINSAGNLTSLVPGTPHDVSCIFIANMGRKIFVLLHVLPLGFVFISLRARLRWWKDLLLFMSKARRVSYRPCYNVERRLVSCSDLND